MGRSIFTCLTPGASLTQDQLHYVLYLLTQGWGEWQMRTYLFARFAGIKVLNEKKDGWLCETELADGKTLRFFLQLWQVQSFCEAFDYVFDGMGADNRLDHIGLFKAVDVELHGVAFANYLTADNYFQSFWSLTSPTSPHLRQWPAVSTWMAMAMSRTISTVPMPS